MPKLNILLGIKIKISFLGILDSYTGIPPNWDLHEILNWYIKFLIGTLLKNSKIERFNQVYVFLG